MKDTPATPTRGSGAAAVQRKNQEDVSPLKEKKVFVTPIKKFASTTQAFAGDVDNIENDFLLNHMIECNRAINSLHESVAPKFTLKERIKFGIENDYGGITGTIQPSCVNNLVKILQGGKTEKGVSLEKAFQLREGESVFCDIGCGTGRPTFYFGGLKLRASIGFDIDKLQVFGSCSAWSVLKKRVQFNSPIALFHMDLQKLKNLNPVTHAYVFVGYEGFVTMIAEIAVRTPSLKTLVIVTPHAKIVSTVGLYDADDLDGAIRLGGMKMPSGVSYPAFVIPMTSQRKEKVKKLLAASTSGKAANSSSAVQDLSEICNNLVDNSVKFADKLIRDGMNGLGKERPKRKCRESESSPNAIATSPS